MARATGVRRILVLLVLAAALAPALVRANDYVAGGTVVFKQAGSDPAADSGAVACNLEASSGIGGGCIPFPLQPLPTFVAVNDVVRQAAGMDGMDVAFQVCLDTDGDMKCTSRGGPPEPRPCDDIMWFSHNDKGDFYNPLGPLLPTRPNQATCNPMNGGFNGYVVFICEAGHVVGADAHSHPSAMGTIDLAHQSPTAGMYGNFCGGIYGDVVKHYFIT